MALCSSVSTLTVTASSFGTLAASQSSKSSLRVGSPFKLGHNLYSSKTNRQISRICAEVKNDSVTDQAKKTAEEVAQQFENVARKGEDLISQSAGAVEEKVEGAGDFVRNTGIDIETNASKTVAQGEDTAKNATNEVKNTVGNTTSKMGDEAQSAAGSVRDKVGNTAQDLQEQAQDDKNVGQDLKENAPSLLNAKGREFVNHDAARDDENQEEGPGSDRVPKDGVI